MSGLSTSVFARLAGRWTSGCRSDVNILVLNVRLHVLSKDLAACNSSLHISLLFSSRKVARVRKESKPLLLFVFNVRLSLYRRQAMSATLDDGNDGKINKLVI